MKTHPSETAFEFRATVRGISPLIWRKVRVSAASSLHDLHGVVCTVYQWTGSHPYQFTTHGQAFSSTNEPNCDARFLTLADLNLRVGETFTYFYRSQNSWELEL